VFFGLLRSLISPLNPRPGSISSCLSAALRVREVLGGLRLGSFDTMMKLDNQEW